VIAAGASPTAGNQRDFLSQRTAGRVAELDGYRRLYDLERQIQRQSELLGIPADELEPLPFIHPPLLVPGLKYLSRLPERAALRMWGALTLILFGLAALVATSLWEPLGATKLELAGSRLMMLTFFPVGLVLAQGQSTALMVVGVAGCATCLARRRDLEAGLLLSLVAIRPHVALFVAVPFLFARRRVALGTLLGAAILITYSLLVVGFEGASDYIALLRETGSGAIASSSQARMPNLLGLLRRIGGPENALVTTRVAWISWLGGLLGFCAWWRSLRDRVGPGHVAALVAGSVLLAPHMHLHDLAVLSLLPITAAYLLLLRSSQQWQRPVLLMALSSIGIGLATVVPGPLFDAVLVLALAAIIFPLLSAGYGSRSDQSVSA
jgi:hypothetical protein